MRAALVVTTLFAGLALAACSTPSEQPPAPATAPVAESTPSLPLVMTILTNVCPKTTPIVAPPFVAVSVLTAQCVASSSAPADTPTPTTTAKAAPTTTPKSTQRAAPTIGAQCRDGDEKRYEVCAGHKEWVDGQVEFAKCPPGNWNIDTQKCTKSARTKAPSPRGAHSSNPGHRDANGETKAEYCARTGQNLSTCQAG